MFKKLDYLFFLSKIGVKIQMAESEGNAFGFHVECAKQTATNRQSRTCQFVHAEAG